MDSMMPFVCYRSRMTFKDEKQPQQKNKARPLIMSLLLLLHFDVYVFSFSTDPWRQNLFVLFNREAKKCNSFCHFQTSFDIVNNWSLRQ